MRIVCRRVLGILLLTAVAGALSGAGTRSTAHTAKTHKPRKHRQKAHRLIACSTATSGGPPVGSAGPAFTNVGGQPFGVATVRGYAFVADATGSLDVLDDSGRAPRLLFRIGLGGSQGMGVTMTADGRYLLVADGSDGAVVVDVARAEVGDPNAVLGTLHSSSGQHLSGAVEVVTSPDGRFAFVALQNSNRIAVYGLSTAIANHFSKSTYLGAVPVGDTPVGLALSPDGRWLYSTSSQAGQLASRYVAGSRGALSVISVATAERSPGRAVAGTVTAGCAPVRVAVSPNGAQVWVTARDSDDLLAFSAAKLRTDARRSQLAMVRVGEAPVGLAVVDGGREVVVADSNRFHARGKNAQLTVVSASAALAHRPAIVGTVRSGLFPVEMALEPAATVLLVGNYGSGTLESVHISARAQETRLRRAKPRADD